MTSRPSVEPWGVVDGRPVSLYTLQNSRGSTLRVTNYGATIVGLSVPDRDGVLGDVVLGFDDLSSYAGEHPYLGCVVGRCANRIAGARFELDGESFELAANDGAHHLHGGMRGFDKHVWDANPRDSDVGPVLKLDRFSPDGEEGYPGGLRVRITYQLTEDDELRTLIFANCFAPTICNLVQHTYWNLAGHSAGDIRSHELELDATQYTPVDGELIPTGELAQVAGTDMDFTQPRAIERELDHNFVLAGEGLRRVARVVEPGRGRRLELWSDQPGCQVYTGNSLDGSLRGKSGAAYEQYGGICLETQFYPDAVHRPQWPSPVLRPGGRYRHIMVTRFSVDAAT